MAAGVVLSHGGKFPMDQRHAAEAVRGAEEVAGWIHLGVDSGGFQQADKIRVGASADGFREDAGVADDQSARGVTDLFSKIGILDRGREFGERVV